MSYAAAAYALVVVGVAAYARWLIGSARRLEGEVRTAADQIAVDSLGSRGV